MMHRLRAVARLHVGTLSFAIGSHARLCGLQARRLTGQELEQPVDLVVNICPDRTCDRDRIARKEASTRWESASTEECGAP